MIVERLLIILTAAVVCSGYGGDLESCLRFGGGSCCQVLNAIDRPIQEDAANQPIYTVFFPNNEESYNVDSDCWTFFPVPDDSSTYIIYTSRVYKDGSNEISSFISSQPEIGIRKYGGALCAFTDTIFDIIDCDNPVIVSQRCQTFGDCRELRLIGPPSGVLGLSEVRRPISKACLNKVKAAISNNGLPDDDYIILPMKLPTRCVLNQICSVASNLQRFCKTVGIAFPTINSCANQYY